MSKRLLNTRIYSPKATIYNSKHIYISFEHFWEQFCTLQQPIRTKTSKSLLKSPKSPKMAQKYNFRKQTNYSILVVPNDMHQNKDRYLQKTFKHKNLLPNSTSTVKHIKIFYNKDTNSMSFGPKIITSAIKI